jgi:hypothetical protein
MVSGVQRSLGEKELGKKRAQRVKTKTAAKCALATGGNGNGVATGRELRCRGATHRRELKALGLAVSLDRLEGLPLPEDRLGDGRSVVPTKEEKE